MAHFQLCSLKFLQIFSLLLLLLYPATVSCECTCDDEIVRQDKAEALRYKLGAIASILVSGAIGVSLPLLGSRILVLSPENDLFFMIKAFAAGVILSTGFVHILPDAFKSLTSPCIKSSPWGKFPFSGFIAMLSAIGTLMIDAFATGYYKRQHLSNHKQVDADDDEEHAGHMHVHTHATHGHAHGSADTPSQQELISSQLIRQRIISQVLEVGIVVHSVVIGISLGASQSPDTIKPLVAALSFHQFFEGMGLGGCISQAEFKSLSVSLMGTFFSLTTPMGIAVGIGISSFYTDNSPAGLIMEGVFNSCSAGILIYMALVDLLAADFMNPRLQSSGRLQFGVYVSLLLGTACMSGLAKWA